MTNYQDVKDAMAAGTPPELICATCPWDRLCIQPPTMTTAQVQQKIEEAKREDAAKDPRGMPAGMLVTALAYAGKDSTGQMCPVFSMRLRSDRRVADAVRETMRTFGEPS